MHAQWGGVGADPAVDLQRDLVRERAPHPVELVHRFPDELLGAPAGVDAHAQGEVQRLGGDVEGPVPAGRSSTALFLPFFPGTPGEGGVSVRITTGRIFTVKQKTLTLTLA